MSSPSQPPAAEQPAPAKAGVRPRWLLLIIVTAFLFVLMPFLFWQATWFGRPLTDAQIDKNLADREHPRKAQHALSQIADRMLSREPTVRESAKRFYPQIVVLASSPHDELRLTAAWVMGEDNSVPEFHQALGRLLQDANPMVQRNAALALVRFGDASGRGVIAGMLGAYAVPSPAGGALSTRLKPGDVVNPGTLVGHIQAAEQKTEIRTQVPGTLDHWLVADGAQVAAGQPIVSLAPSPEAAWEALRALYLIGQAEDLPAIQPFLRPLPGFPEAIRQQAQLTAEAIRSRSPK